jgi:hypothetical protein
MFRRYLFDSTRTFETITGFLVNAQTVDGPKDEQPWEFERGETQEQAQSTLTWMKEMFRTDGKIHRAIAKLEGLIERVSGMKMRPDGSPEDYEHTDHDIAKRVARIIAHEYAPRRVKYQNGDGGDNDGLNKWHLAIAATGMTLVIIGAAWRLSEQMSTQFATQSTLITGIKEHDQEQDARTLRIEQQLQREASERR